MHPARFPIALAGLALLALLTACQGDDDADATAVEVRFETVGADDGERSANGLLFTGGTLIVSEIQFSADLTAGGSVDRSRERVVTYDLATGLPVGDAPAFDLPAGDYRDVYLGVELRDEDATPSIVAEGSFVEADGATEAPIRFEFNSGEVFEAEAEGPVAVEPGTTAVASVRLRPEQWFAGISAERLAGASRDAEGVIVISERSNEAIFDVVADGLDVATDIRFE